MTGAVGIGGVFFRAAHPAVLARWYGDMLGVGGEPCWRQEAGPTVFAPFPVDTEYFPADRA